VQRPSRTLQACLKVNPLGIWKMHILTKSQTQKTYKIASMKNVLKNFKTVVHLVVCLTIGPKPLSKRALHTVQSRASSFKWQYPLLSLRSSNSFPRLLPRLPVTSIPPFTFTSITCCRRQFLRKMWPIQLAFRLLISCRIFLCSLTLSNTSSFLTWSVQLIFSILLQHQISKLSRCFWSTARSVQVSASYIKLCSKCSTSQTSTSIPSLMCQ